MSLSRRELLSRGLEVSSAIALGVVFPMAAQAETINPEEKEAIDITREFISFAKNIGRDALGDRQNDAWKASNGRYYIVYQRGVLERLENGNIQTFAALDVIHNAGLDSRLDSGEFEITIPPVTHDFDPISFKSVDLYSERLKYVTMPQELKELISSYWEKGLDVGLPTSESKDYGAYCAWRFKNMAFMQWKDEGRIEGMLIGETAFKVGMVPDDKQTITPQIDLEPEFKQQERFSPSSRGGELGGCQITNETLRGTASYYDAVGGTTQGCLGCRVDLIMMNGERFDPNRLTTAININYARRLLNKYILFQNPETGVGVISKVTDSGGFGHLADMSRATAEALGFDKNRGMFPIVATVLNC
jgi:hypothetical protein